MICCNNKKDYEWFKKARLHGINADGYERYTGGKVSYEVEFVGWKMNMTDVQAVIAMEQLKKLPQMDKRRIKIRDRYNKAFGFKNAGLHLYTLLIRDREKFINYLADKGIACSIHFPLLHQQPAYKKYWRRLPSSEYIGQRIVSIPFYSAMTDEQVDYVIKNIKEVLGD